VKVGDKIPNLDVLVESSPGNKVNLSEAITGKALIIGVPAAFSKFYSPLTLTASAPEQVRWRPTMPPLRISIANVMIGPSCSNSHIPGFINHKKLKSAGDVFVVAVNDPFV
jgi:2-Cys peroxiredoxin 5